MYNIIIIICIFISVIYFLNVHDLYIVQTLKALTYMLVFVIDKYDHW